MPYMSIPVFLFLILLQHLGQFLGIVGIDNTGYHIFHHIYNNDTDSKCHGLTPWCCLYIFKSVSPKIQNQFYTKKL